MIFGIDPWAVWLSAAVLLVIFEIMSGTVALLCIGLGCVAAAVCDVLGMSLTWQAVVAVVSSLALFFSIGSTLRRLLHPHKDSPRYSSNADALIGRRACVICRVTGNVADGGRVKIDGDNWQAFCDPADEVIEPGQMVEVVGRDSIILKVKSI